MKFQLSVAEFLRLIYLEVNWFQGLAEALSYFPLSFKLALVILAPVSHLF